MGAKVVVAGAGMAGFSAARRLERRLGEDVEITVVNPTNGVFYPPLYPEVASGMVQPRQVAVPLRAALRRSRFVRGEACELHHGQRRLSVHVEDGASREVDYDHLVVALGSVSRLFPVPGLAERALGFTTLAEARFLRDWVIDRLELASASPDPVVRRRALRFVVVGGGYSGVEAIGELAQLSADVAAAIPDVPLDEVRWVLVEASDRLLGMVRPSLAQRVRDDLESRGIDVRLETSLQEVDGPLLRLSDGTEFDADTLVWCAGVVAHPAHEQLGLPLDDRGRVQVDAGGQVEGLEGVWAAGDGAAFPDVVGGGECPPSAQYAVRQGRQVAENIARRLRGEAPQPLRYRSRGELISLGRHRAVGEVLGIPITGRPAWHLRRAYHMAQIPTARRKFRLWIDWTANLAFPPEIVSLGDLSPRAPIDHAARSQGFGAGVGSET